MAVKSKSIIARNFCSDINVLVYEKMGCGETLMHNKVFVKKAIFSIKMFPLELLFWLTQDPNTSKHIPRNKGDRQRFFG